MNQDLNTRRGFTLIELIAVIVILAVLVGVALPKYFDYAGEARIASTKGTLGGVRAGIANYFANSSIAGSATYPDVTDLNTIGNVMQEDIPPNPYDDVNDVYEQTSQANALSRTLVGTSGGWAYYTNGTSTAIFYANTDTATVSENDF